MEESDDKDRLDVVTHLREEIKMLRSRLEEITDKETRKMCSNKLDQSVKELQGEEVMPAEVCASLALNSYVRGVLHAFFVQKCMSEVT